MPSLLLYLHTCFMRSYRYGPPTFVFLGGIVFIYSVVPNPVMDSYAFSTTFLFMISAILCYSLIDIEASNQESVTLMHSGSLLNLYIAKLLYCWLFTAPLALFAVLYPAIFHAFNRNATLEELCISLIYHLASSWLGVALACWFSSKFIQSRVMSFLSLSLLLVITLATQGIENSLPEEMKLAVILLPPLTRTIYVMMNYDTATMFMKLSVIGASVFYGLIVAAIFLLILHKRKLDSHKS